MFQYKIFSLNDWSVKWIFGDFFDWKGSAIWEKIKIIFGLIIMIPYELFIKKYNDKLKQKRKEEINKWKS